MANTNDTINITNTTTQIPIDQTYYKFNPDQDMISSMNKIITDNIFTATGLMSASNQSGSYYASIYQSSSDALPTYMISVGCSQSSMTASNVIYNQFKSLLSNNPSATSSFTLYNTASTAYDMNKFGVITFRRDLIKDGLNLGSLTMSIFGSGSTTSSIVDVKLSSTNLATSFNFNSNINVADISILLTSSKTTYTNLTFNDVYGFVYNKMGLIFLDMSQNKVTQSFWNTSIATGSNSSDLLYGFTNAINKSTQNFTIRNEQYVKSKYYVCRIKNKNFNYSNNPTWTITSGSSKLVRTQMQSDPVVYITSVGLYNDNGDLLAIAKTSKPIAKSFDRDITIKVKLDF